MAKSFYGSGFAAAVDVMRCSVSVRTVIAASVIAVQPAATPPDSSSDAAPTAGISGVLRVDWTIATGNGNTGAVGRRQGA
jgi:hypothetical protein